MRCPVLADEGTPGEQQCVREEHPHETDAHDFSVQGAPEHSVDGGQHWATWIASVNAVRSVLLNRVHDDSTSRYGDFAAPEERLGLIAQAVGLRVVSRNGVPEEITEE